MESEPRDVRDDRGLLDLLARAFVVERVDDPFLEVAAVLRCLACSAAAASALTVGLRLRTLARVV